MRVNSGKLSHKIVGTLIAFLLALVGAIGLTLAISWRLEGAEAAINDAGSQRMRTYQIDLLMTRALTMPDAALNERLAEEIGAFDRVLQELAAGNPRRPLATPGSQEAQQQLSKVEQIWQHELHPQAQAFLLAAPSERPIILARFERQMEALVTHINNLILLMERDYAQDTALLRAILGLFTLFVLIGAVLVIRILLRALVRPVGELNAGMGRMTDNDLAVRLPVTSDDELGGLARGFNQMADHLQTVYATLEQRVVDETRSLEQRNRELAILYAATSLLNEPVPLDTLCQNFLDHIKSALGADAGAVRLYAPDSQKLYLTSHDGLSEQFINRERELNCGECLCGEVIQSGQQAVFNTINPPPGMKHGNCIREGFATSTAFSIVHGKQRLGVFNLYFRQTRPVSSQERNLLETLGQHLGVAIENQRLRSSEMELAVSEERNLLAQELHDSIAQGLAFLNIQVQLLQDSLHKGKHSEALHTAEQLREGVQESYDDVRELLVHFRARVLQSDLDSALTSALEKFEGQTGIATRFERIGVGAPLAPANEIQIMHIVQESLSNIRKHARAKNVYLTVRRAPTRTEIEVCDDGIGFDTENEPNVRSERHVGLKIMRERAHRVGGELRVVSNIGAGSRLLLSLPRETREGV
ncbi:MAG: type IV pili methyl-accepting chemotaxis transducer N-terminal domain-containing protein [Betaproteobacteria bacterium]|nr:type IV pili methyl-accepting chemotaxis transducer N-terminal domain-containing protein [Betaproteobacteria bacterium]MCL2886016.1 type IV pili methyl-accepting chemotaxis transducer N-terminal domain-containing protein [Betaproteobacteria bacterium]